MNSDEFEYLDAWIRVNDERIGKLEEGKRTEYEVALNMPVAWEIVS